MELYYLAIYNLSKQLSEIKFYKKKEKKYAITIISFAYLITN